MAETKKKTAAKPKRPPPKNSRKKDKPLVPRRVWAGVCFVLAFVCFLALFNTPTGFISWIKGLFTGLLGPGFFLAPFVFLIAGILLLTHLRSRVRARVAALLALPVLYGALFHLFVNAATSGGFKDAVAQLYASGQSLLSGGVIGGGVALAFHAVLFKVGGIIITIAGLVACFVFAFWRELKWLMYKLSMAPEGDEPPRAVVPDIPLSEIKPKRQIDIALDDDRPRVRRRGGEPKIPPPNVPTPAETVRGVSFTADEHGQQVMQPAKTPKPPEPASVLAKADEDDKIEEQLGEAISAQGDGTYIFPSISLLDKPPAVAGNPQAEVEHYSHRLVDTLESFGISASIAGITRGPTVTRYDLLLERGVKFSRVAGLSDDIALALGAAGVRISTVPDRNAVGIEVPNDTVETVCLRELLESDAFRRAPSKIAIGLGKDIANNCIVGDISKMPHLLIAGTTGSGKSVCVNALLLSLLYKSTPEEVRLIMIDPKMIELGVYNGIPHLLIPVVTDPRKAAGALNWGVAEMMRRYRLFSERGVRDLASYNDAVRKAEDAQVLPQIVIVIDELADLMFVAAGEVEEAVARIAQMARAAGMHLIIATQRPSADVITGIMKANIPSRIAFAVSSQLESRIILDTMGAEKLIGRGDMLYSPLGVTKPLRVQGCLVTTPEVERIVEFIKKTGTPDYSDEVQGHIEKHVSESRSGKGSGGGSGSGGDSIDDEDELLPQAIGIAVDGGQISVSMLQRRLKLGYSRAARLVDQMEERGIVGPHEGSKPRQVLITSDEWKEMLLRQTE